MTTKEKAKAYDEAKKKMHEIITMDDNPVRPTEIAKYLFPELAESEDERIRKFLVNEVMGHIGMLDIEGDRVVNNTKNELWEKALAYLERQKKQKPAEWSVEDRKMLNTIISDGSRGVELDAKQVNFLKSLCPQYRRKPSEGQPGVDLEKEIDYYIGTHFSEAHDGVLLSDDSRMELAITDVAPMARHFYELGLNARKEGEL